MSLNSSTSNSDSEPTNTWALTIYNPPFARQEPTPVNFDELSTRSPEELVRMQFSDQDLILKNAIMSKKQGLTILGPGGVGKSRLAMQLAICVILKRDFLGLETSCPDSTWLFLQAENGNRRLNHDLTAMQKSMSRRERKKVDEQIMFHTLEHELDERLQLSDPENSKAIARLIKNRQPQVVVYDPLSSFSKGCLNSDTGMRDTCREATTLARLGKPDAAVVLVHHAQTGKKGVSQAVGFDRTNYGRGSKVLHSLARGAINVAPGDPINGDKIVVACGKNSNGPDFPPIGAILNKQTMLYEIDLDFNLLEWQDRLNGGAAPKAILTPDAVAEVVRHMPLSKKDLANQICEEYGCKKSTAYNAIKKAEDSTIVMDKSRKFSPAKKAA